MTTASQPTDADLPLGAVKAAPSAAFCFGGKMATLNCEKCGQAFQAQPSAVARGRRFCSHRCAYNSRPATVVGPKPCVHCGKPFARRPSEMAAARFCSLSCAGKHVRGDRNWLWNGGNAGAREYKDWMRTPDGLAWRRAIIERAGHKCQECGTTDRLVSHHIRAFRDHPEARTDLLNGRCLCVPCHARGHVRIQNAKRQLDAAAQAVERERDG